ncbi:hypothetical protein OGAPHI_003175 [Ogataea philodendri]|uniref:Sphingomyelin phosphodiesterase n=1 Tax=Ogataea philodendri TaxID=1378263 RepID=A0A9P8P9C5_9ASCO|nr:uncharacterized protein OGAPHI_003175 [Ogataea philodendri]KAH3667526.1 hypothetical protein OGAPHI_003175 [Ogataea philodendri]
MLSLSFKNALRFLAISGACSARLDPRASITTDQHSALEIIFPSLFGWEDLANEIGQTIECDVCQAALVAANAVIDIIGDDLTLDIATDICKTFEKEDVCTGAVGALGPYVLKMITTSSDSLLGYGGELICNSFMGTCTDFEPKTVDFTRDASSQAATNYINSTKSKDLLTILHISDIHYDPAYSIGSEADCGYPLCCEERTQTSSTVKAPATKYGAYLCDSPIDLVKSFGEYLESTIGGSPDFTLFTGDVPPHNVWYDNETTVTEAFTIYSVLGDYLKSPVYATFGNHDTAPVNLIEPALLADGSLPNQWALDNLGSYFGNWLPSTTISQFESNHGIYSVRPAPGLKLINLNTVDCYYYNFYVLYNGGSDVDPNDQLQWLVNELEDSKSRNESVWIQAHIAPGDSDCVIPWSNLFNEIVNDYSDIIKGQFYGHSHEDKFILNFDYKSNAVGVQYLAPSITTFTDLNTGYRVYKVDPESYEIVESLTYYADISATSNDTPPEWKLEYSARDYVPNWPKASPLNATFWNEVLKTFEANNTAFELYSLYMTKSCSASTVCTEEGCKAKDIAQIKSGNTLNKYYTPLIDVNSSKNLTTVASTVSSAKNSTSSSLKKRCMHI